MNWILRSTYWWAQNDHDRHLVMILDDGRWALELQIEYYTDKLQNSKQEGRYNWQ